VSNNTGIKESFLTLLQRFDKEEPINEAQTRFQLIDETLSLFGWPKNEIVVERHHDRNFTDYELGLPPRAIVEAKKAGSTFDLGFLKSTKLSYSDTVAIDQNIRESIEQCANYCVKRGVPIAICTNGFQYAFFLASRTDGTPPNKGDVFLFCDLDDYDRDFALFFKLMSFDAIKTGKAFSILTSGADLELPAKLSTKIPNYGGKRYRNRDQETLRHLSQLLIEDIPLSPEIETKFLEKCYCRPGAISSYSLLTEKVLRNRYQGIVPPSSSLSTEAGAAKLLLSNTYSDNLKVIEMKSSYRST